MGNIILAIPNDQELAARLGKKGSTNGVTFYNRKDGDSVFAILSPTNAEAKFNAVAEVLTMSDNVVVSTKNIDKLFGESVIGCSLLGKSIVLTSDNDASAIMQRSGIQSMILDESQILGHFGSAQRGGSGEPVVEIDHSFDVKGVGVILLGIVKSGTLRAHDELFFGTGKKISVRSIQSQDQDIKEAGMNTRVGIAIRGAESGEISKGDILSKTEMKKVSKVTARISVSQMVKEKGLDYSELWLVCGFRSSVCRATKVGEDFELSLAAQLALAPGERFLLVRKEEPRIFASGIVE